MKLNYNIIDFKRRLFRILNKKFVVPFQNLELTYLALKI